jgi:hypothetical protein
MANFFVTCMAFTDDLEVRALVRERKWGSTNRVKKFESNISNGRKIFRLLEWINEVQELVELIQDKKLPLNMRLLRITLASCGFVYNLTDNILWFANMNFCSPYVLNNKSVKWK